MNDASAVPVHEKRLIDFRPGESFDGAIFAAVGTQVRPAANGTSYLQLKLRDCTGERNARWFSAPDDIMERLGGAKLVRVRGTVDATPRYRGDFKLYDVAPAHEPDDLTPFLMPLPADQKSHEKRFLDVIASVRDPHMKDLLRAIFRPDNGIWERFVEAPAAKSMHHANRGGLLEHSGEVAMLCDRNAAVLPYLNRDLLVTCALLHDIGKLEELESGLTAGEYTPAGQLVGHVILGTHLVAKTAETLPGFPPRVKHEVMHLILSHHGRIEHGAARWPMCAEAVVLSLCDLMSAKVAQVREVAGKAEEDEFPKIFGWDSDRVYVGMMREIMQGLEEDAAPR